MVYHKKKTKKILVELWQQICWQPLVSFAIMQSTYIKYDHLKLQGS